MTWCENRRYRDDCDCPICADVRGLWGAVVIAGAAIIAGWFLGALSHLLSAWALGLP